jgi:hypothetical protein
MYKNIKIGLMIYAIFCLFSFISSVNIFSEPTIENVILEPNYPEPASIVTFTVTVTNLEEIDSVRLIVKECDEKSNICFQESFNVSMKKIDDTNNYQKEITLRYDEATYISYHFEIKSNGEWFIEDSTDVDLKIISDNSNSNNDGKNGSDNTPGFEILLLFSGIIISVVLFKRKRF